jgi:uncharacterized protein (TIGR00106 family)
LKVTVDLTVIPIGVGVSLSAYVAACQRVLAEAGLKNQLHANGTDIEGEWDAVFAAIKRCHEVIHDMGAPRISTIIKVGTRTDRDTSLEAKVHSVQAKLAEKPFAEPQVE